MLLFILFVLGLVFGSFLNVVALRYDGSRLVLSNKVIGGRSHCPHCGKTLQWYELIPLVSFIIQRGRCRNCHARLGFQYPLVELLSGFIFLAVPARTAIIYGTAFGNGLWNPATALTILWIIVFEALLLMSYIDIRLGIIPDELNFALGVLGILITAFTAGYTADPTGAWIGRFEGAVGAGIFFWLLVVLSPKIFKQEGMGWGDVKLGVALGLIFGGIDVTLTIGLSFILGAIIGIIAIVVGRKTRKATLPFGPFLALGATCIFFFGSELLSWYFRIIGI